MFAAIFRKVTALVTTTVFSVSTLLVPAMHTSAQAQSLPGTIPVCSTHESSAYCATTYASGAQVMTYPKIFWTPVAELSKSSDGQFNADAIAGDRRMAIGDRAALAADMNANEVAEFLMGSPDNEPVVFGRYSPGTAQLRIDAYKTVREKGKVVLYSSYFAPEHGKMFAAARTYQDEMNKAMGMGFGYDPFSRFGTPGDPVFNNITPAGAIVAMGHAMKAMKSTTGVMAMLFNDMRTWTTKSGGAFRKKITTHIAGDVVPRWFVLTPPAFQQTAVDLNTALPSSGGSKSAEELLNQPNAFSAVICAYENGESACGENAIVPSYVVAQEWTGGTFHSDAEQVYYHKHTKKSWTVVAFAFVAAILTAGAFLVVAAASPGFAAAAVTTLGTSGASMSAVVVGSYAAAGYAVANMALNGGNLTSTQQNFLGNVNSGYMPTPSCEGEKGCEHLTATWQETRDRGLLHEVDEGATLGNVRATATALCDLDTAGCPVLDGSKGALPRVESHTDFNMASFIRDTNQEFSTSGVVSNWVK